MQNLEPKIFILWILQIFFWKILQIYKFYKFLKNSRVFWPATDST